MITVLFACVHNAGRSQIAAALFNRYADPRKARAISAGTQPAARVHPEVIEMMRDRGFDLSSQLPQKLTPEFASTADWLITMGCGDDCPVIAGVRRDDWPILDPRSQAANTVNAIADEIDARVRAFAAAERLD
jgi:arsenate reductase